MDQPSEPRHAAGSDLVLVRVGSSRVLGGARSGVAFTGLVEGAGENVTAFKPGDAVSGSADVVFAGYVCVPQDQLAPMPANYTP